MLINNLLIESCVSIPLITFFGLCSYLMLEALFTYLFPKSIMPEHRTQNTSLLNN